MAEKYSAFETGPDIAKQFNTTPTAVYAALKRLDVGRRPPYNGFLADCDHHFFDVIDNELKAHFRSATRRFPRRRRSSATDG